MEKSYLRSFPIFLDPLHSHNIGFHFCGHSNQPVQRLGNLQMNKIINIINLRRTYFAR